MAQPNKKKKTVPVKKQPQNTFSVNPEYLGYFFLGIILLTVAIIRIRLLSFPLERDEGEYAYFGQLILQGIPPYKLAYNLKLPGTYYSYALIMSVFGQTDSGIRFGLLLFNLGSITFLYFIGKKLFNIFTGATAAAFFAILSISPSFLAQAAHATHFVTFYALGGTFLLILAQEKKSSLIFLFSGLMMGLAFIMKQSGLFFSFFGGLMILVWYFSHEDRKIAKTLLNLAMYGAGVVIPFIVVVVVMKMSGVFEKFWFWTMTYPGTYGSRIPVSQAGDYFILAFKSIFSHFSLPWITAGLGLVVLAFYPKKGGSRLFALIFFFFSFLPVVPGFYFRSHYFIPFLPAVGLMAGIFFDFLNQKVGPQFKQIGILTGGAVLLFMIIGLNKEKDFYFNGDPVMLCKMVYQTNPFAESPAIAKYLNANTTEKDNILVLGSEPQICFYAKRHSATGYIYMYDLVFNHPKVKEMQNEMLMEAGRSKPKFIVFANVKFSWIGEPHLGDTIIKWTNSYLQANHYKLTGIVDIAPYQPSEFVWNDAVFSYKPKNENTISIFRREDIK